MIKLSCFFSLLTLALTCQVNAHAQLVRRPLDASQLQLDNPPVNLQRPSALTAVPADMPNRFDPNVFELKEQTHDMSITDLLKRVGDLESTSSWMKGAFAGFIVAGGLLLGFLKLFWKGIVTLILREVSAPPALNP